ncbi:lipase class 3 [Collinsella sp. CAG:398]|nr:lipase class 3 [Collinsella sp. CAG:398]
MNPSDLVPRLPLASWGYARYGRDLWLPGYGDATFNDRYADMQAAFEENVGAECPYVPEDRAQVDAFIEKLGEQIPTQDDLVSAGGIASLIQDLAVGLDPVRVLYGHYPGVYIAWMQVIDADDLRSS